jgi:iron(III) transport system permease protein
MEGSPPLNVYSLGWINFLQGTALATPAFFMMVPAFEALDSALEEGAYTSGIRKGQVFFRITLPLLLPSILTALFYYLIIAMEIFDFAGMLGLPVRVRVLATWIYERVHPPSGLPRYNEAAAIGFLSSVLGGLLMLLYFWMSRRGERFAVVTGKRGQQRIATKLGRVGIYAAWTAIISKSVTLFWIDFMIEHYDTS